MGNEDKISKLEERIQELEKQVEGATIFLSNIAPLLNVYGRGMVECGQIDDGAMVVSLANQLKKSENCSKLFLGALENKDMIISLGKQLESEVKKLG